MVRWDEKKDLLILVQLLRVFTPQVRDAQIRQMIEEWPASAGPRPSAAAVASRLARLRSRAFGHKPGSSPSRPRRAPPALPLPGSPSKKWAEEDDDDSDDDGSDDGSDIYRSGGRAGKGKGKGKKADGKEKLPRTPPPPYRRGPSPEGAAWFHARLEDEVAAAVGGGGLVKREEEADDGRGSGGRSLHGPDPFAPRWPGGQQQQRPPPPFSLAATAGVVVKREVKREEDDDGDDAGRMDVDGAGRAERAATVAAWTAGALSSGKGKERRGTPWPGRAGGSTASASASVLPATSASDGPAGEEQTIAALLRKPHVLDVGTDLGTPPTPARPDRFKLYGGGSFGG